MKHKCLFIFPFFLGLFQNQAQNQPSLQKEKLVEFRTLFVQNVQLQKGNLSNYKNINFTIDECFITIETIDFEKTNEESVIVLFPTSGAKLKKNGELYYKNKVIKEIIENKITKLITINLYKNSKYIGLLLKLKNKEQYKKTKEKLKVLSRYCKLEKK
jgi:hypothetical protein